MKLVHDPEHQVPDEREVDCIANQLRNNGYRVFAGEVRAMWAELERLRHDVGRAMANHNADLNASRPEGVATWKPSNIQDIMESEGRIVWINKHVRAVAVRIDIGTDIVCELPPLPQGESK